MVYNLFYWEGDHLSRKKLAESLFSDMGMLIRSFHHRSPSSDFSRQQVRFLLFLQEHRNKPMTYLSEHLLISKPNLSKLVNDLIESGYVKRVHSENDRRVVLVDITEEGRKQLRIHYQWMLGEVEKLLCVLTDQEVEEAYDHVQSLVKILGKIRQVDAEREESK